MGSLGELARCPRLGRIRYWNRLGRGGNRGQLAFRRRQLSRQLRLECARHLRPAGRLGLFRPGRRRQRPLTASPLLGQGQRVLSGRDFEPQPADHPLPLQSLFLGRLQLESPPPELPLRYLGLRARLRQPPLQRQLLGLGPPEGVASLPPLLPGDAAAQDVQALGRGA